ncbi:sodium:solute symporter family protein [Bacteroides cellulosilyticus]|jgi:SSS family solute:Na+ symporter|uniref:sodium:solute symporter family protein n=1 Tax=Bacteroides cellulosilyticus TaxID=246787 RepID=UPI0018AC91AC|nr:sodium:solute symporter family protein [Bacteroides cellulosilyticus]
MTLIDYCTILIFIIGMLLAGLSFSGKGTSMKSFFAAGGSVPWGISGLSLFMGFFSAGTFVVWGSIAYTNGLVAITIQTTMCIAGFLVGAYIAPRWHKTGALTAAEYITKRFGVKTQKSYTYLFLLISLFTTGSFLYPIAKIVEVSTGFNLYYSILILGVVCILYVALGGLWAVVITDVLQFVILTVAVLITVPLSLDKIGGIEHLFSGAPDGFFDPVNSEYTWGFIIAFGLYNAIFIGGNWAYVQRYTSVKSGKDSKKVGFLFGSLYMICPILWMLPPMIYRIYNSELTGLADEGAYLLMCKEALPNGLLGLMLGGMIFATASSLNSTLNISAGVFTNDVFKNFWPQSSEKTLMRVAKLSTLFFGLLAICVALLIPKMGGIVNVVISVAALTGVPLYLPVIWSLFSKYQTKHFILTVTIVSLFVNAFFKFVYPLMGDALTRTEEMVLGVAFPVCLLAIYELHARVKHRIDPDYTIYLELRLQEVPTSGDSSNNRFGIKVIGVGVNTTGVLISILGIFANHSNGLVLSFGVGLLVVGSILLYLNRK